jgi:glutamine amidotransferase
MSVQIGLVDYGMGNLKSLGNALGYLGVPYRICSEPDALAECSHVIIPGVGAFEQAMKNLTARGFVPALQAHLEAARPLLGICLGMQLLASRGTEPLTCAGLGIIPGAVAPLSPAPAFPTPHVGWNSAEYTRSHPVIDSLKRNVDFYFVHSYHFQAAQPEDILATTDYGPRFCSVVARGNVIGVQFHPEKSQEQGLRLLENFSAWNGQC